MKLDNKMIRLILGAVAAICLLFLPIVSVSASGYGVNLSASFSLFDMGLGAMFEQFATILVVVAILAAAAAIYGALKDKQICLLASAAGAVAALIGAIAMPEFCGAGWGLWVAIVAFAANVYFSLKD